MAKKIIYWIATGWLGLGLISTGLVQVFNLTAKVDFISHLGYPTYFLTLLGLWKILGAVTLLIPKFTLLKEWAYAGIFFTMTGAVYSHIAFGDAIGQTLPSLWLLILAVVSWSLRPANRRIVLVTQ